MIKAIIFDIGGVLLRTTDLEPRRKWERRLGLQDWTLEKMFFSSDIGQAAQVGKASTDDAWAYVIHTLGLDETDLPELKRDFWVGDTWDADLLALIKSLKARYKTAIISNAMPDARANMKELINGNLFDVIVFSGEEGVKKPAAEIFQRALQQLNIDAHEAVFIDDVLVNVQAACDSGMHAIQFMQGMSAEGLKNVLKTLGVSA